MLRSSKQLMKREDAEETGIRALQFLSEDEDRLNLFLTRTGLQVEHLRAAAASKHFFASVMDYLISEDELIMQFSAFSGLTPEQILAAAHVLGGAR